MWNFLVGVSRFLVEYSLRILELNLVGFSVEFVAVMAFPAVAMACDGGVEGRASGGDVGRHSRGAVVWIRTF